MRRSLFIVSWFVLLFIWNFVMRATPDSGFVFRSFLSVEYMLSPIEIIASIIAIAIILRLIKETHSRKSNGASIIQDK